MKGNVSEFRLQDLKYFGLTEHLFWEICDSI